MSSSKEKENSKVSSSIPTNEAVAYPQVDHLIKKRQVELQIFKKSKQLDSKIWENENWRYSVIKTKLRKLIRFDIGYPQYDSKNMIRKLKTMIPPDFKILKLSMCNKGERAKKYFRELLWTLSRTNILSLEVSDRYNRLKLSDLHHLSSNFSGKLLPLTTPINWGNSKKVLFLEERSPNLKFAEISLEFPILESDRKARVYINSNNSRDLSIYFPDNFSYHKKQGTIWKILKELSRNSNLMNEICFGYDFWNSYKSFLFTAGIRYGFYHAIVLRLEWYFGNNNYSY